MGGASSAQRCAKLRLYKNTSTSSIGSGGGNDGDDDDFDSSPTILPKRVGGGIIDIVAARSVRSVTRHELHQYLD